MAMIFTVFELLMELNLRRGALFRSRVVGRSRKFLVHLPSAPPDQNLSLSPVRGGRRPAKLRTVSPPCSQPKRLPFWQPNASCQIKELGACRTRQTSFGVPPGRSRGAAWLAVARTRLGFAVRGDRVPLALHPSTGLCQNSGRTW